MDLKIIRTNIELIEIIVDQIQNGHFPLFIIEGTAVDKLDLILVFVL
jgi:hypothetical protein